MPKTERELRVERLSRGRLRAVKGQISPEVDGVWLECDEEGNRGGLEPWMVEHVRLMVKSLADYRDLDLGYDGETGGEAIALAIQRILKEAQGG